MKSQWFELKPKAISLRTKGKSIRDIETSLNIPRSTLSGWLKNVKLTKSQEEILKRKHEKAIVKARIEAVKWHNKQKEKRLKMAKTEANITLEKIINNTETIELGLALLYLGEGFKKVSRTGIGNTDPLILKFFLKILLNIYKVNIEKIRFELHLRYDQSPEKMKKYWAKTLNAPIHRFKNVSIDNRTINKSTYYDYKGVCIVDCGSVAIQRRLVYIGRKFCENIIKKLGD